MKSYCELVIILVALRIAATNTEWIQIAQTNSGIDRKNGLALDNSAILDNIYSRKDLKYEDLEELIGPGFEGEFGKFLEAHKGNESNTPLLAFDGSEFTNNDDEIENTQSVFTTRPNDFHKDGHLESHKSSEKDRKYANETLVSVVTENERKFDISKVQSTAITLSSIDDKVISVADEMADENQTENADKTQSVDQNKNVKKKKIVLKMVRVKSVEHPFSLSAVMKFLKNIQETLVADATGGIKNKIKSLETFKNQLVLNIRERLSALWPAKKERSKRDIWGGHDHGLKLASLEISLITIAFLTFAVFLIKLVLQVIHTIKSKSYSFNAFDTYSPNRPLKIVTNNQNARKFSLNEDNLPEIAKILTSTESNRKTL